MTMLYDTSAITGSSLGVLTEEEEIVQETICLHVSQINAILRAILLLSFIH